LGSAATIENVAISGSAGAGSAGGSAAGPAAVYLLRHGQLRANQEGDARLQIEQGVEMGRPSRLSIALACQSGEVQDVRVGGESVLVAEGSLILP